MIDRNQILVAIDRWLSTAAEYAESGFYFEEGGCIGMAFALNEVFGKSGLKSKIAKICGANHVGVIVEGHFFDYQGSSPQSTCATPVTLDELERLSVAWGNMPEDVASDKAWALEIINTALELFEERGLE